MAIQQTDQNPVGETGGVTLLLRITGQLIAENEDKIADEIFVVSE